MDAVAKFNLFEAIVWFLVSSFFLHSAYRNKDAIIYKKIFVFLSIIFVIFGISDLIEIKTGHWSKPIGLLLLKGGCIIAILVGYFLIYLKKKGDK